MSTQSIVAGTDGSASAQRAVEHAGELALALGATVHVVTAYRDTSSASWMAAAGGFPVGEPITDEDAKLAAEEIVKQARDHLISQGVDAHGHVCSGDPAQALLTVADDQGAEMIVVGNRGMSGARRVLGSVPNSVSHNAKCGVLIVPTT
jgi:nucleotide-binding universal stress UspA family protein